MFYGCCLLNILPDISIWNTLNIIDITDMFKKCYSLYKLPDISKWNFRNKIKAKEVFSSCVSLVCAPILNSWNIYNSNCILENMFDNCCQSLNPYERKYFIQT